MKKKKITKGKKRSSKKLKAKKISKTHKRPKKSKEIISSSQNHIKTIETILASDSLKNYLQEIGLKSTKKEILKKLMENERFRKMVIRRIKKKMF